MSAKQGAVTFLHAALAKLLAERSVNGLIARNHHQPGRAEIQTMHQRAAGEGLNQTIVYRIAVLRIFAREAEQTGRLIDQQQMFILPEDRNVVVTRWGNKRINNRRHQAAGLESGSG